MNRAKEYIEQLNDSSTLFTSLGLVFLFLPILFYAQSSWLSSIGSALLIFCYIIILRDTVIRTYIMPVNSHTIILVLLIMVSILSWLVSFDFRSIYNLVLCIVGLYIIYFFSDLDVKQQTLQQLFLVALAIMSLLVPLGLYMGFNGGISVFVGYEPYINRVIFKLILPLSFFVALVVKQKYLVWIPLILTYIIMIERTSAMAMIAILLAYYLLPIIKGATSQVKWVFFAIIIMIFLFNAIYLILFQTEFGMNLNQEIAERTSKKLFTGRQIIWTTAIEQFMDKPFLGHGFDPDVLIRQDVTLSTHNAYLYILIHTGLSGLLLFIAYLYSYWRFLSENWSEVSRLTLAYMTAILIFINFELTLIANTMVLGLFYSLVIGIGVSVAKQHHIKNNRS